MGDFLTFRRMITPIIIQIVFWIGIIGILVLGILVIVDGVCDESDVGEVIIGVLFLIIGPLIWRVFCEILILTFRIIETLADLRNILRKKGGEGKLSINGDSVE